MSYDRSAASEDTIPFFTGTMFDLIGRNIKKIRIRASVALKRGPENVRCLRAVGQKAREIKWQTL